jgi:hypothetical protein
MGTYIRSRVTFHSCSTWLVLLSCEHPNCKMSQSNVVLVGFTLIISYVIVTAIYRLYFHPLAKFPGPFWARLTTFPAWWHSKNQDRHLWLLRLQEQYGETKPTL